MKRVRLWATLALAAAIACGTSARHAGTAGSGTAGPSGAAGSHSASVPGEVPAELRDLEQASEDLIAASFGQLPDRTADWNHAETLYASLKSRWSKAKASVKGLPSVAVKQIDVAVAALSAAVAGRQQQETAAGAIKVFLAVPDLFAAFKSSVPIEVVRMDALGMEIALEGHFMNFDVAASARDSLLGDWTAIKSDVTARVATCTRVPSVRVVEADVDASLMRLADAITAQDPLMIEGFAEAILNQVDTLQLLFNCPVGDEPPAHGLGSRCTKTSACDSDQVCDATNDGGRCAPDPARFAVGSACTNTIECGNDHRVVCASEAGDNFPAGYCMMEPCDDIQVCPPGATCVTLGAETPACMKSCTTDADCRIADGYICQFFLITPPIGFGPSEYACSFPCTRDTDCFQPLTCDIPSGKCKM